MNKSDELIITVRTLVECAVEEEFNEWQFEEHVPWILSVQGYENVRRYKDAENEHRYVNVWGLTDFAGHDCEDHERKSKSPWGKRLKRYRKLKVDFYHKLHSVGEAPVCGKDAMLILRFNPKEGASGAEAAATSVLERFSQLVNVRYAALYKMDRGTAQYMLRVHTQIVDYFYTDAFRLLVCALADQVDIDCKELYSAMADTSFAEK